MMFARTTRVTRIARRTGSHRVIRAIVLSLVVGGVPLASATPALAKGLGWS